MKKGERIKMSAAISEYRTESFEMDLNDIKVHEEMRIRKSTPNLEPQIEAMMLSFQEVGQLHRISIDEDDYLISGYIRLIAAIRLNIKVKLIKRYGLSGFEKYLIEIQENATRTDFTSHDFTLGLVHLKRMYEEKYPQTKWGQKQCKKKDAESASIKNSPIPNFAKSYSKLFNLSMRTIQEKVQVGEAILNNKFDKKTIRMFKEEKITYSDLIEKLRAINRVKKEKEELLSKNQKKNHESEEEVKDLLKDGENREVFEPKRPHKKVKSDSIPDKSKKVKESGTKEKRMEETLPVLPPPPPLPQNDAETKNPPGFPTIQTLDDETRTIIAIPATCKDLHALWCHDDTMYS